MKPEYEPYGFMACAGYLTEEIGEVLHALGKSERWGLQSTNPEIPPEERETNEAWLRRELIDLKGAIDRMEATLDNKRVRPNDGCEEDRR
jgi:NTP pyrophosphatase (non-canonical NTP hydrolase)